MAFGMRITDTLYAGGQPSQEQVLQLPSEGFRRIIDLRPPTEDHGFDEPLIAARANLTYLSLPIAGETDLTPANVRTLDQWLADPAQPKVLVHCGSSNRVGALLALRAHWLHGSGNEAAIDIGRAAGLKGLEPAVRSLLARSMEQ
jgi:uncharacterized protein (TIGR01244 family)